MANQICCRARRGELEPANLLQPLIPCTTRDAFACCSIVSVLDEITSKRRCRLMLPPPPPVRSHIQPASSAAGVRQRAHNSDTEHTSLGRSSVTFLGSATHAFGLALRCPSKATFCAPAK